MIVRIFGSTNCHSCLESMALIKKVGLYLVYVDAFDDDEKVQQLCDKYDVDDLPHIQFINNKGEIIIEHKGPILYGQLKQYLINL